MRTRATFIVLGVLAILLAGAVTIAAPRLAPAGTSEPASAPLAVSVSVPTEETPSKDVQDVDQLLAEKTLAELATTYKHLENVKVVLGDTPKGEEAVAYYRDGEIVIDRDHTVGTKKILAHEIWHVIDYRDNGRLDWGEDLPPANSADYIK